MADMYLIQMAGIALTALGIGALTLVSRVFGTRLTRRESKKLDMNENTYRLPLTPETVAAAFIFLAGLGILFWSGFEACAFLNHWLPGYSPTYRVLLSCR